MLRRWILALFLVIGLMAVVLRLSMTTSSTDEPTSWPQADQTLSSHSQVDGEESSAATRLPHGAGAEIDGATVGASPSHYAAKRDATLVVRVIGRESGKPVRSVSIEVLPLTMDEGLPIVPVSRSKGTLGESLRPDEGGEVEFAVPSGKRMHIHIASDDHQAESVDKEVSQFASGERRLVALEVLTREDLTFWGRTVSNSDGRPITSARIDAVRADRSTVGLGKGPFRTVYSKQVLRNAYSDAEGFFEISLATWKDPHLRVAAEGFGLRILFPTPGHETRSTAALIAMDASSGVKARVLDRSGHVTAGISIRLVAKAYSFDRSISQGRSSGAFASIPDEHWEADCGRDGYACVSGLPAATPLQVQFFRGGRELQRGADPVVLLPQEVRVIDWLMGDGCTINGIVRDQTDAVVANQELWLQRPVSRTESYFRITQADQILARATSDSEGRFEFGDVAAGQWLIGPAARQHGSDTSPDLAIAPLGQLVSVESGVTAVVTLRAYRGLYIGGQVVDPAGAPVPGSRIDARTSLAGAHLSTWSEPDGSFRLGPIGPNRLWIHAGSAGLNAPSERIQVDVGQLNVTLRLRPGGGFSGHVIDAGSGEGCAAQLTWSIDRPAADVLWTSTTTGTGFDGAFAQYGLEPGTYGLLASTEDGRFGVLPGVAIGSGAEAQGLALEVSPGGSILLRYEGATPGARCDLRFRGIPVGSVHWIEAGKSVESLVPAGQLTLEVRVGAEARSRLVAVDVQPGGKQELVLRDNH